jgi:REP element-mobilizing transposase RayT
MHPARAGINPARAGVVFAGTFFLLIHATYPQITSRFQSRKKIRLPAAVYDKGHAFFITITTHKKYPWFSQYPELCQVLVQFIKDLSTSHRLNVFAWCIMPDHIHLLIQGVNIIKFVRLFKGKLTPIARYIWENPIRAKIVEEPPSYRWSGSEVWPDWRRFYRQG